MTSTNYVFVGGSVHFPQRYVALVLNENNVSNAFTINIEVL